MTLGEFLTVHKKTEGGWEAFGTEIQGVLRHRENVVGTARGPLAASFFTLDVAKEDATLIKNGDLIAQAGGHYFIAKDKHYNGLAYRVMLMPIETVTFI